MELLITDQHYNEKHLVLQALHEVLDPELCINIVDLGLVYDIAINGNRLTIYMTLSTKACPLGGVITAHAKLAVTQMLPQYDVTVSLIWDPKWTTAMINDEGKALLGW